MTEVHDLTQSTLRISHDAHGTTITKFLDNSPFCTENIAIQLDLKERDQLLQELLRVTYQPSAG